MRDVVITPTDPASTWVATVDVSGTDIRVRVTGAGGTTIDWCGGDAAHPRELTMATRYGLTGTVAATTAAIVAVLVAMSGSERAQEPRAHPAWRAHHHCAGCRRGRRRRGRRGHPGHRRAGAHGQRRGPAALGGGSRGGSPWAARSATILASATGWTITTRRWRQPLARAVATTVRGTPSRRRGAVRVSRRLSPLGAWVDVGRSGPTPT